ncbi:MAG: phosphodiester glycosidase family protein [Defluviitaleaceae bacterium]|nr:phosphodiester glycosidase family protein [Defluviitaleaceae bacterium]
MKKGIFLICLLAAVFFGGGRAYALDILFEHRETMEVSRGVVYEQNRMMTTRGMLDVHVLTVDVNQPYITLAPVYSDEMGLRETTSRMLYGAGAVAGINADFFNTARMHSTYFGPMVRDGEVISLNAGINAESHELATFFLDMHNNPFFRYMRTNMRLYANGIFAAHVITYNSVGPTMYSPMVVSRAFVEDTADIDRRIPYVTKFVVRDDVVTQVTTSSVQTPENGFVILIPHMSLPYYQDLFRVGTHVRFFVGTDINVDFSSIRTAIGGGAVILNNGALVEGGGIQPNLRHPRTAVGATRDGRIILMAVDGRSHSVGVTHAELGALLQRYGAINAMHMDGGGSTTMVTRSPAGVYSVANRPSDGGQRRVTNALGVFNNSPVGAIIGIVLEPVETRAVMGVPLPATVFGVDFWGNRLPLNDGAAPVFLANPAYGFWSDGRYTPTQVGTHLIEVRYGAFHATATVEVFALGELRFRQEIIGLLEGGRAMVSFTGIATDGTTVNIPEVPSLTVSPAYLGVFDGNEFIALRGGTGHIAAAVGGIRAYIPVTVGGFPWPVNMFGTERSFLSMPAEYVFTQVTTEQIGGIDMIRLSYSFGRTARTQASYVTFYPPLALPGEPIALRMQAYGDGSGHWFRARVRDYDGNFHNIDFAREADFVGWETVTANLPNAPAPFTLDRIYMVVLEHFEASRHSVVFHSPEALFAPNHMLPVPVGTVFQDNMRAAEGFTGVPSGGAYEFMIPENAEFSVTGNSRFAVVNLSAGGGGIQAANVYQWLYFMPGIRTLNLPYVVILLDRCPTTFSRRMEAELLHLALQQLNDEGRTVFVVSSGEETRLNMRDNIRYITMEGESIRFWTDGERIWWN